MANFVEKLNAWRVTMTYPFLNRAADVLILVEGQKKAGRLQEAQSLYQQILSSQPRHAEAMSMMALLLLQKGANQRSTCPGAAGRNARR